MKTVLDLCRVCAWALRGEDPDAEALGRMDLTEVWRSAVRQQMEALAAFVFLKTPGFGTEALRAGWKRVCDLALFRMLVMDRERGALFDFMEREGIWHMPLKGLVLRALYPKPELRQMSDNDILFDGGAAGKVHAFMTSLAYRAEEGWQYDRSYKKEPCCHFELHKTLLPPLNGGADLYPHFLNVPERLIPVPGTRCEMAFRDEDFYLYLLAHARKHDLEGAAAGLRVIVDLWLFLEKKEATLDRTYLDHELERMRLLDFERGLRGLARTLLAPGGVPEPDADAQALLARLVFPGGAGPAKVRELWNDDARFPGATYLAARLFPPARQMREVFPFCKKCPLLLPLAYILRFGACLKHARRFLREAKQAIAGRSRI